MPYSYTEGRTHIRKCRNYADKGYEIPIEALSPARDFLELLAMFWHFGHMMFLVSGHVMFDFQVIMCFGFKATVCFDIHLIVWFWTVMP